MTGAVIDAPTAKSYGLVLRITTNDTAPHHNTNGNPQYNAQTNRPTGRTIRSLPRGYWTMRTHRASLKDYSRFNL